MPGHRNDHPDQQAPVVSPVASCSQDERSLVEMGIILEPVPAFKRRISQRARNPGGCSCRSAVGERAGVSLAQRAVDEGDVAGFSSGPASSQYSASRQQYAKRGWSIANRRRSACG
jgi:hypothetical protein